MKRLMFCLMAVFVLCLVGCKSKEYVTVPEYHTEYVLRSDTIHKTDSIYVKDSVFVYQKGDTIIKNKVSYRDRLQYIYKVKLDTIIKRDSIPYPVERKLTKNEQRLMTLGKNFIVVIFLTVIILVALMFYRNKKC